MHACLDSLEGAMLTLQSAQSVDPENVQKGGVGTESVRDCEAGHSSSNHSRLQGENEKKEKGAHDSLELVRRQGVAEGSRVARSVERGGRDAGGQAPVKQSAHMYPPPVKQSHTVTVSADPLAMPDCLDEEHMVHALRRQTPEWVVNTQRKDGTDAGGGGEGGGGGGGGGGRGRASVETLSLSSETLLSCCRDGAFEPFDTMNASTLATHSYCNSLDMSRIGTVPG